MQRRKKGESADCIKVKTQNMLTMSNRPWYVEPTPSPPLTTQQNWCQKQNAQLLQWQSDRRTPSWNQSPFVKVATKIQPNQTSSHSAQTKIKLKLRQWLWEILPLLKLCAPWSSLTVHPIVCYPATTIAWREMDREGEMNWCSRETRNFKFSKIMWKTSKAIPRKYKCGHSRTNSN